MSTIFLISSARLIVHMGQIFCECFNLSNAASSLSCSASRSLLSQRWVCTHVLVNDDSPTIWNGPIEDRNTIIRFIVACFIGDPIYQDDAAIDPMVLWTVAEKDPALALEERNERLLAMANFMMVYCPELRL